MNRFRSVCVYCGSSTGKNPVYTEVARELAAHLVNAGCRLVNGGGSIGLMGVMADRVLELGGEAIGVIPLGLKEKEVAHPGMTELIVVPDMHSRKLTMVNLSDAFIAMPGGYGTLDELFETLTWAQLHLHHKPVGLLNVRGYFDPLLDMINKMHMEDFLHQSKLDLLQADNTIDGLFEKLYSTQGERREEWNISL